MTDIVTIHGDEVPGSGAPLDLDERRDSLVGQIASNIAREIGDGTLLPGADLNSVELAARFQTSRTPVREALMLLEKEGLVEIPPRRRPRVATISMREVEELYEIRAVLNGLMMREFLRCAGENELGGMDRLFDDLAAAADRRDLEAFSNLRGMLHNYWVDHCGNASLQRLLRTYKMRLSVHRLGGDFTPDIDRIVRDHATMVTACHARDAELAVAQIQAMTRFGLDQIRQTQRLRDDAPSSRDVRSRRSGAHD